MSKFTSLVRARDKFAPSHSPLWMINILSVNSIPRDSVSDLFGKPGDVLSYDAVHFKIGQRILDMCIISPFVHKIRNDFYCSIAALDRNDSGFVWLLRGTRLGVNASMFFASVKKLIVLEI